MTRIRLSATIGLTLLTLFLTPVLLLAADSAVVVPFFSSQKTVTTGTAIRGNSQYGTGLYGFSSTGYGVWGCEIGAKGYGIQRQAFG